MAAAARAVQTNASQGCTGAMASSASMAIGGKSASVCVTREPAHVEADLGDDHPGRVQRWRVGDLDAVAEGSPEFRILEEAQRVRSLARALESARPPARSARRGPPCR
jgi:hypothetical protein